MFQIEKIYAREILDSRGNPTVEVEVEVKGGRLGRAAVPSGASTGVHEAHELRDGGNRYLGKGVIKAVTHVNHDIARALVGRNFESLEQLDKELIDLDGTPNKAKLGANAILGVSLAALRALGDVVTHFGTQQVRLPVPLMNVLNGGAHADNGLDVQEFMVVPVCGGSFREALRAGSEVFHTLKKLLLDKGLSTAVGDEGGFAPVLKNNTQALELLLSAIEKAGYRPGEDIFLALDVAATELFESDRYRWEDKKLSAGELGQVYAQWLKGFPLVSIEDGFSEDDWDGWTTFTKQFGEKLQIVGDDLFVTNPKRIGRGIEQGAANAVLIKVNQIGTVSETREAIVLAHQANYRTIMSHRSGETEDTIIADLSLAFGCAQIKTGSLCRGERTAKYNQLLRLEERFSNSTFAGRSAFRALKSIQ